jgi:hypothetical protein
MARTSCSTKAETTPDPRAGREVKSFTDAMADGDRKKELDAQEQRLFSAMTLEPALNDEQHAKADRDGGAIRAASCACCSAARRTRTDGVRQVLTPIQRSVAFHRRDRRVAGDQPVDLRPVKAHMIPALIRDLRFLSTISAARRLYGDGDRHAALAIGRTQPCSASRIGSSCDRPYPNPDRLALVEATVPAERHDSDARRTASRRRFTTRPPSTARCSSTATAA